MAEERVADMCLPTTIGAPTRGTRVRPQCLPHVPTTAAPSAPRYTDAGNIAIMAPVNVAKKLRLGCSINLLVIINKTIITSKTGCLCE